MKQFDSLLNKPYELIDEVILKDNLTELSNEESLFLENLQDLEFNLKSQEKTQNSSSFFTDTNFSFRSKKGSSKRELIIDEFDKVETVDNLYYILKQIKHSFYKPLSEKEPKKSLFKDQKILFRFN